MVTDHRGDLAERLRIETIISRQLNGWRKSEFGFGTGFESMYGGRLQRTAFVGVEEELEAIQTQDGRHSRRPFDFKIHDTEPLAAEYQADIIAKYGTPVGGDSADRFPVSEEESERINKKLLERLESGKPLSRQVLDYLRLTANSAARAHVRA